MSSTIRSYGLIGLLKRDTPLTSEERDDLMDRFDIDKIGLSISYDGRLLILDVLKNASFDERNDIYFFDVGNEKMPASHELSQLAVKYDLSVDPVNVMPFRCIWHNGSDAPFNDLSVDDFMDKLPAYRKRHPHGT